MDTVSKVERAFYRSACHHWRAAFPRLPDRSQFNRLERQHRDVITAFALHLVDQMQAQHCLYEALDSTAAPTRDAKRRHLGWLAGQADSGWSNRIGWYEGFHVLVAVNPDGVITGFGFGAASTHDHPLATTLFAIRQSPTSRLLSAGKPAQGVYVADKGFAGARPWRLWKEQWHAEVVRTPSSKSQAQSMAQSVAEFSRQYPTDYRNRQ